MPTEWTKQSTLSVVILGASGDVARRKTIPALFNLWKDGLVPKDIMIYGFGRTPLTDDHFQKRLFPFLSLTCHNKTTVQSFVKRCVYQQGSSYEDTESMKTMAEQMKVREDSLEANVKHHRMFYLALPPDLYEVGAKALHETCLQDPDKGFTRLVVEKPFGRDLESFEKLDRGLSQYYEESQIYRIDHYLANSMVQSLSTLRFSNRWVGKIWDRRNIQCVILTFKDKEGTELRGGYFDKYGIVRDVFQSHSMQVLSLLAMETPSTLDGPAALKAIRDAKITVLNAVQEPTVDDVVFGQYDGYSYDPTIENPDTKTPTFATMKLIINTPRWSGVPFILKAGKAMDEDKTEIRVQFKDAPGGLTMFGNATSVPRNEFVMSMHPKESVYFKTNVKKPGFSTIPVQSELEVNYESKYNLKDHSSTKDPYTRLMLDVCLGNQAAFVSQDELRRSWEILTPLLQKLDRAIDKPTIYKQNSRGPKEADDFVAKLGYVRNEAYQYYKGKEPKVVPTCDIGLWGLAVMGQNFALNMASHGFKVCVGNRSPAKVGKTVERAKAEGDLPIFGAKSVKEFVANLKKPRKVVILVQAGKPVDETIANLSEHLEPGDVIVDGGNEWYPNSVRRAQTLEPRGIHFVGMGISGGEEGARNGPSLMPGGPREAYGLLEPILIKCAAQVEKTGPCVGYLGPVGSGNYVKMVHNGIEYGDMQLIAEVYDILKSLCGMTNLEMSELFKKWNKTELDSYLIEITTKVLARKDDQTGKGEVVDYILDKTGMKGTGRWTIQEAAEKSVAAPTMAAALETRFLSGRKDERQAASKVLAPPILDLDVDSEQVLKDLRMALYASKICSYAQGLSLIKAASDEHNWEIDLAECARLWTGGCIIRASLLDKIQQAFASNPDLPNLLIDPGFAAELNMRQRSWRRIIALAVSNGIACPSLCGSLTYFDAYRRARLPANLTQAQRDFFGGHTFERTDMAGRFHTAWTDAHKDIGDTNQRVEGETIQT